MNRAEWQVGVVIPAHDEEGTIRACLRSVSRALEAARSQTSESVVVVVADSCRDETVARALAAHGSVVVIEAELATAGRARATGCEAVLHLLGGPADRIWIANTDADSVVGRTWILRQLRAAASGFTCVTGIVDLVDADPGLDRSFRHTYAKGIRAWDHDHVHGANLGVRADVLRRVGNWSSIETGEDHELWRQIRASGAPCLTDPGLVVSTSARTIGRAPAGFACDLRTLVGQP